MEYSIIRSKNRKRTIEFNVINNKIVVYAPFNLSDDDINIFFNKHKDKLLSRIKTDKNLDNCITYLGKNYNINIINSKLLKNPYCEIDINKNIFNIYKPHNKEINTEEVITKWKTEEISKIILNRIKFYINKYDFKFDINKNTIKYKNHKTKWGSCSYNNNLNFNYNVISKNLNVIDYLVIHELTHTIIKNHSKSFWNLVENILPNYKELRKQLKDTIL